MGEICTKTKSNPNPKPTLINQKLISRVYITANPLPVEKSLLPCIPLQLV